MKKFFIEKKKYNKVFETFDPSFLEIEAVISRSGCYIKETRFEREVSPIPLLLESPRTGHKRKIGSATLGKLVVESEGRYLNVISFNVMRRSFIPIAKALLNKQLFLVFDFDDTTKKLKGVVITYANPYDEDVAKCNGDCIREMYKYDINLYEWRM